MRALLITVGSRGDAEPYSALAAKLASRDHQVDLFLQPEHHGLVPTSPNINVHELPFTQLDFYRYVSSPSHGTDHPNPRVKFIGIVTDCIGELVLPCWEQVLNVSQNVDCIVSSSLARPLCIALSKKLDKPLYIIHLQPLVPTGKFPHYSSTDECVQAIQDLERGNPTDGSPITQSEFQDGYWELEKHQHDFLEERLDQIYAKLDLPKIKFEEDLKPILHGRHDKTYIINAFSTPEIVPHCSDGGENIYDVGALADGYVPEDWKAPNDLSSFLEHNSDELPICVGYGSMPFSKVDSVIKALKEVGKKAVFVGDALKSSEDEWTKENVCQVSSVPYAWLLPHCSMLLCHGGAGTVHVALRAGVPVVISPLMGDQFTWARLLEAKGLGVKAGSSLNAVTAEDLAKAITQAFKCKDASKRLGATLQSMKLGVDALCDLMEAKTS